MRLVKPERKDMQGKSLQIKIVYNRTKVPQSTRMGLVERKVGSNEIELNRITIKKERA